MDYDMTTLEARREAARVLEAGSRLAAKAATRATRGREVARLSMEALGNSLMTPSEFWTGACILEGGCDIADAEALALGVRYAAARMATGDFAFVRESLLGQAQWASVQSAKLAFQASGEAKIEGQAQLLKLAALFQRQAAQALATAAALNKLVDAETVSMT